MRPAYQPTCLETCRGFERGIMPNDSPDLPDYPEMTLVFDQIVRQNKVEILLYALVNQNNVNNVLRQWNREMGRYSRILGPPLDAQSRSSVHGALPEYDSTLPPRVAASKKRKKQQKAKKKLEAASAVQEPDTEARYSKEEMHAFAREYAKTVIAATAPTADNGSKPATSPVKEGKSQPLSKVTKRSQDTSPTNKPKKKKQSKSQSEKTAPKTKKPVPSSVNSSKSKARPQAEVADLLQDGPQHTAPQAPPPLQAQRLPAKIPTYDPASEGGADLAAAHLDQLQQQTTRQSFPQVTSHLASDEPARLPYQPRDVVVTQAAQPDWGTGQVNASSSAATPTTEASFHSTLSNVEATATTSQDGFDLLQDWPESPSGADSPMEAP